LMEMEHSGIVAELRHAYEAIVVEVNQLIERVIIELLTAPSVGDILANEARPLKVTCFPICSRTRDCTHCSTARLLRSQKILKRDE
jgi:hypothetical protein